MQVDGSKITRKERRQIWQQQSCVHREKGDAKSKKRDPRANEKETKKIEGGKKRDKSGRKERNELGNRGEIRGGESKPKVERWCGEGQEDTKDTWEGKGLSLSEEGKKKVPKKNEGDEKGRKEKKSYIGQFKSCLRSSVTGKRVGSHLANDISSQGTDGVDVKLVVRVRLEGHLWRVVVFGGFLLG